MFVLWNSIDSEVKTSLVSKAIKHPVVMWPLSFAIIVGAPIAYLIAFLVYKEESLFYLNYTFCFMEPHQIPFYWPLVATLIVFLVVISVFSVLIFRALTKIKNKGMYFNSSIRGNVVIRCLALSMSAVMLGIWFIIQFLRARFEDQYGIQDGIMMLVTSQIGIITFFLFCSPEEIARHLPLFGRVLKMAREKIDGLYESGILKSAATKSKGFATESRKE